MNEPVLFSAKGVCRAFGPTRALVDVDIEICRGEVRGLIGENGSGKSTFSSIVAGAQREDSGTFTVDGKPYTPRSMVGAQDRGSITITSSAEIDPVKRGFYAKAEVLA